MAVTAKDCHAMTSYFLKQYEAKYGRQANVNRYSARWGFDAILSGMSMDQAKALVDYYLTTPPTRKHDLDWLFYNYEKIVDAMNRSKDDAAHRIKLMEESKKRAELWRQSGKQGITND